LASESGRYRSVAERVGALEVLSPISGVVVTPRPENLIGAFVQEGAELAEVDNVEALKARIFIPEFQVRKISLGAPASLKLESLFRPIRGRVNSIAPSSAAAPGVLHEEKYKGIAPPSFYIATVLVSNQRSMLLPGMDGDAKIQVRRQSVAAFAWGIVREFVQRKVW
jgi:multidrug efflux pump subunit AcrA (membrane-fusion protein)